MPAHLKRITRAQLYAWWLQPMADIRASHDTPSESPSVPPADTAPRRLTLDQFKAAFGHLPQFADKPAEWWAAKHKEWNDAAATATT